MGACVSQVSHYHSLSKRPQSSPKSPDAAVVAPLVVAVVVAAAVVPEAPMVSLS